MDYLKYRNKGKFISDKKIRHLKTLEVLRQQSIFVAGLLAIIATSIIVYK